MTKVFPTLLCLALGAYLVQASVLQARAPASVPQAVPAPLIVTEAMVQTYFKDIGINKSTEIYRKFEAEFRALTLSGAFKDVGKFPNLADHQIWLKGLGERLQSKSAQWRGVGTIVLGGQSADIELHLSQVPSQVTPCFTVDAYIRLNGALTPLASNDHCPENLLFRDGDYFLSWPVYDQFLSEVDLSLLTVALPTSKNETVRYIIDGETEWQTAALAWTPLTNADRVARISEISNEIVKGGQ